MKYLKHIVAFGAVAGLLLYGCQASVDPSTTYGDSTSDKLLDEAATKISYYESLVVDLQQEILDLKGTLYTTRAEYDALYALYHASDKQEPDASVEVTTNVKDFQYVKENGGIRILSYQGSDCEVVLPTHIDGLPVRAIHDRAFAQNTAITAVTLPEGVESIGWFAFSGCSALRTVSLPASLAAVAYGAFDYCHADLTVSCPQGSYASQYAASYGLKTK